ncbi:MAG: DnaJ domain-containing protein, partial [Paludibacteraceae bacterium]|nr:DnaJ domain-containing protein [Paludibacteraceae bacterium]
RDLDKYTPPAFLTERFFSNYMKKWGMTESEVEEYVRINEEKEKEEQKRKRYLKEEKRLLLWIDKTHISPIIHQICQMNLDAREAQEQFLKEVYPADKIKEVFETEFTDSQFNEAIKYWRKKDLSDKKMFVNYLYKFTILADGIHKDEWNFMISLMSQLRFSEIYIEYFANRYYALRTDFEDSKSKHGEEGSSTTQQSDTNLDSYYSILGVSSDASYEEVRKAYHSLALTHHPDLPKNAGRIQECEDLMIKFNEAYNKIIKN